MAAFGLCCKVRAFANVSHYAMFGALTKVRLYSIDKSKPDWDRAVNEAEKIVGYPSSFANLRWLMSDEVANVALHLRKLVGSDHPILRIAKTLLYGGKNNTQAWGLLILLISKAVGNKPKYDQIIDNVEVNGLLHSQRTYAEITEMIKTGHIIHKSLVNIRENVDTKNNDILVFGNKIALLTGDYLLATANGMLSNLKDQHLSELISSALRDLTEAEFIGERIHQNTPIPSKPIHNVERLIVEICGDVKVESMIKSGRKTEPLNTLNCIGDPVKEWTMRNLLNGASLLGRGCQGALHLGGHDESVGNMGYHFGCHVGLAWQAVMDVEMFTEDNDEPYSLVSAPVLFALEEDPSLYDEIEYSKKNMMDYDILKTAIKKTAAIEKTMGLYHENCMAAIKNLENFPNTDSTDALRKLILFRKCEGVNV